VSEGHDALVRLLQAVALGADPAQSQPEVARTDAWRWYCRTCGTTGDASDREARDASARAHLASTSCGRDDCLGWAESGRLLHVWTYPAWALTTPSPN
jgi:hypothetical protein